MNELVSDKNNIQNKIYIIRGISAMLDRDLAELYQVETRRINEQVKRNIIISIFNGIQIHIGINIDLYTHRLYLWANGTNSSQFMLKNCNYMVYTENF